MTSGGEAMDAREEHARRSIESHGGTGVSSPRDYDPRRGAASGPMGIFLQARQRNADCDALSIA